MVEGGGGIRGWWIRTFGGGPSETPKPVKAPASSPLDLIKLLNDQLAERAKNSRTQDGSGARGSGEAPKAFDPRSK